MHVTAMAMVMVVNNVGIPYGKGRQQSTFANDYAKLLSQSALMSML